MTPENRQISIRFLGAAGTVTGSKYLVSFQGKNILVDCGLFQGLKKLRLLNWQPFPINPAGIDLVLLTHGHLDHVGYLPRLVQQGYKGPVACTAPTVEVAAVILRDSARIQEEDAERANLKGYSRHKPAKPLYDMKDVEKTLPLFTAHPLDKWTKLNRSIAYRFRYNSHIIGAAFIELKIAGKLLVFSGDIGRDNDPLLLPAQRPGQADVLLVESTYGDRPHPKEAEAKLAGIILSAWEKKGTIIIPSFAVERTQSLMYLLWQLRKKKAIPSIPVYMDSPMGNDVLHIFRHFPEWHKLSLKACTEMCSETRLVRTIEETESLARDGSPKIIIAGSGMATGGRVLTYFRHYLGDPNATVLLVGYQAEGTRGRHLLDGAAEIKLQGQYYSVKAAIRNLEGLSAHADQQGLLDWMSGLNKRPEKIFIVHGEASASDALRVKIKTVYGWDSLLPELDETILI